MFVAEKQKKVLANEKQIQEVIFAYAEYYNQQALQGLRQLFCQQISPFIWGTGIDENHIGIEAILKQKDKFSENKNVWE